MKSLVAPILCFVLLAAAPSAVPPGSETLSPESAVRLLGVAPDEVSTTAASWNGQRMIFADYLAGPDGEQGRQVYAVHQGAGGSLEAARVTVGEQDGGDAELAAIGFANADGDAADELLIILKWRVFHHHVYGDYYEVRLFDELKPGQAALSLLGNMTRHFGGGCDCGWRDGRTEQYRFKTVADVRRELSRLGH